MERKSLLSESPSPEIIEAYIKSTVEDVTGLKITDGMYIEDALYAIALTLEKLSERVSKEA